MTGAYLLDTHALIWLLTSPDLLGRSARDAVEDAAATLMLSAVSGYEMSYKYGRSQLAIAGPILADWGAALRRSAIEPLDVSMSDAVRAGALPDVHRDPFDRLLAAQALEHRLTLVSRDTAFDRLGVPRLW